MQTPTHADQHTVSPQIATSQLRLKDALTAFYMPMHWLWPIILGVVVLMEIIRIPWGLGFTLNVTILFITLALFYYGASRLNQAITAGVHPKTHAIGGLLFGFSWILAVAAANTASATIAYARDYYYSHTDAFFVRATGMRQLIDTNGEPYVVSDGATTISQFAINFAIHLACLAGLAALGALLGTIQARWNAIVVVAFVTVAIFLAFAAMWWMYDNDVRISAPVPGVFLFMIPIAIVATVVAFILSLTSVARSYPLH